MPSSVTITPAQTYLINSVVQVDNTGAPLATPDPTYGSPTFVSSDTSIATMVPVGRVAPTGVLGTTTITVTETSSDTTKPAITDAVTVTVQGPAAAALKASGVIQVGG